MILCVAYCYVCVHRMLSSIYTFFKLQSKNVTQKYLHNKYVGDFIFSLHQLNWFFNELFRTERINSLYQLTAMLSDYCYWWIFFFPYLKCSLRCIQNEKCWYCLVSCWILAGLVQETSFSHSAESSSLTCIYLYTQTQKEQTHINPLKTPKFTE